MGVFAAGLDFAELEQAASVDEADEWTPPWCVNPRPDVARPRFSLLKTTIALNPQVIGAPAAAARGPRCSVASIQLTPSSHSYFR